MGLHTAVQSMVYGKFEISKAVLTSLNWILEAQEQALHQI